MLAQRLRRPYPTRQSLANLPRLRLPVATRLRLPVATSLRLPVAKTDIPSMAKLPSSHMSGIPTTTKWNPSVNRQLATMSKQDYIHFSTEILRAGVRSRERERLNGVSLRIYIILFASSLSVDIVGDVGTNECRPAWLQTLCKRLRSVDDRMQQADRQTPQCGFR